MEGLAPHPAKLYSEAKKHVPMSCGEAVYFLFNGVEIVYIGQAIDILSGVASHRRNKQFERVAITEDFKGLTMLDYETVLICNFMPVYNKVASSSLGFFKLLLKYIKIEDGHEFHY